MDKQWEEPASVVGDNYIVAKKGVDEKPEEGVFVLHNADSTSNKYLKRIDDVKASDTNYMWQIAEKGAYSVLYEFKCGTRGASLPDAVTGQLPLDERMYAMGDTVSAIMPEETEITGPKSNASNAPIGVWKFIGYDVIYEFVASDSSKELPEDETDQKPDTETDKVTHGKTAKPSVSSFTEVKDGDGKWVFKDWEPQEVQNVTSDVTFTGTWEYIANTHKVTYVFDTEENRELPASVTSQLPSEEIMSKAI